MDDSDACKAFADQRERDWRDVPIEEFLGDAAYDTIEIQVRDPEEPSAG